MDAGLRAYMLAGLQLHDRRALVLDRRRWLTANSPLINTDFISR